MPQSTHQDTAKFIKYEGIDAVMNGVLIDPPFPEGNTISLPLPLAISGTRATTLEKTPLTDLAY